MRVGLPRTTLVPDGKVFVDTTPPLVATFRQVPTTQGTMAIEWDVRDDHLDILTLRIEYRAAGGADWVPLNILQSPYGQFSWTPKTPAPHYDVHLSVSDRARNATERYLRATPERTQSVAALIPHASPAPSRASVVNTRNLGFDYDLSGVGKSNVSIVQVWATQDGTNWKKLVEQPPANPPAIQVQVEKEGRWGFKLIARSGVGRGEPAPETGTQPDYWVEVDETKPAVRIQAIDVAGTPENGQMSLRWTASDKHLAERPITISYSFDGHQWRIMASGLRNDGKYVWSIPTDLPHHSCFIRVEAVDEAGNIGVDQTKASVAIDLSIPKVRIKGVKGIPPSASMVPSVAPGISVVPPTIAPAPVVPSLLPTAARD